MRTASIPGFTADISSYKSLKVYSVQSMLFDNGTGQTKVIASMRMQDKCSSICKCCENTANNFCCNNCWTGCP
jgi:hypothetical protein